MVDESEIRQICTYAPHEDVIRSIQFVYSTDRPLVMTASLDRLVHIYSLDLNNDEEDVSMREKGLVSVIFWRTRADEFFRTLFTKEHCIKGT